MYLSVIVGYLTCLALFSTQCVWLCLLFIILCFSASRVLKTIYYFLMTNKIRISPKIVSVHPTNLGVRKLSDFDNIRIRAVVVVAVSIHSSLCFHRHGMPNSDQMFISRFHLIVACNSAFRFAIQIDLFLTNQFVSVKSRLFNYFCSVVISDSAADNS